MELETHGPVLFLFTLFCPIYTFPLGQQYIKDPKTLMDFMVNASYIRMNIAPCAVREQDIAAGNKEAFIKILNYVREQNDFEWRFEQ